LVLRDRGNERFYALKDPNWNVTAISDASGSVHERYNFSPYGTTTFRSATFSVLSATAYCWETLFASYRFDSETGQFEARNRFLHSALGCWVTKDPISYKAGDLNLYRYVGNAPGLFVDPFGMECKVTWGDLYGQGKPMTDNRNCVKMTLVAYLNYMNTHG